MSDEDVCWASVYPEMRAVNGLLIQLVELNDVLRVIITERNNLEVISIRRGGASLMPMTVPLFPSPVLSYDLESLRNDQGILSDNISQVRIMIAQTLEDIQVLLAELNGLGLNTDS
jgi:hypothetical protein